MTLPAESQVGRRAREGPPRKGQMDGCSRQNPAYRSAKEKPRLGGAFLCDPPISGLARARARETDLNGEGSKSTASEPAREQAIKPSRIPALGYSRPSGSKQGKPS